MNPNLDVVYCVRCGAMTAWYGHRSLCRRCQGSWRIQVDRIAKLSPHGIAAPLIAEAQELARVLAPIAARRAR